MNLFERLKNTFLKQPEKKVPYINPKKVDNDLSTKDGYTRYQGFFDSDATYLNGVLNTQAIFQQAQKIDQYRKIANYPDVSCAIEEIINEIVYTAEPEVFSITSETENKNLDKELEDSFERIVRELDIVRNLYEIVEQIYIDGQGNFLLEFHDDKTKGVKSIKLLDPRFLVFDMEKNVYRYVDEGSRTSEYDNYTSFNEYNIDEIIHIDFGKTDDNGVMLSYLERAIKPANQLKTLEDLLIPMRFSRSISRRVFNVDVSDMPNKFAETAMKEIQEKFKYKKFYNVETGEVSNQQHVTSMVEDYWFANRNGQKGTTVDLLDESGNLGELGDIKYMLRKLYKSLGVPTSRISDIEDNRSELDIDSNQLTREDIKFYQFIERVRKPFIVFLYDLLKRDMIYSGKMTETDFEIIRPDVKISFRNESYFLEKIKNYNFSKRVDLYSNCRDYSGSLFSVQYLYENIFKFTEEEIKEMMKQIQNEKKNPLFKHLYETDEEISSGWGR